MSALTTADWIGIYGAVAATLGGLWQFYRYWTRGPKLTGYVAANMMIINDPMRDSRARHVTVTVQNRGTESTQITNVGLLGYNSILQFWFGRPSVQAIINHAYPGYPLPAPLKVGDEWRSMCTQDDRVEELIRTKIMCFSIYHSFSGKPFRVRIPRIPIKKAQ